jgi:3-hydroxybutyryl-CoA dehydratase
MSQRRIDTNQIFPAPPELDGIHEGLEFGPLVFGPITREDIERYAAASGDFNPVHTDEEYARRTGAPTVFAMGMLPAGYLATAVSRWFGGPQHLVSYKVRFTTRVWPGDEVVCSALVTGKTGDTVSVAIEAKRRGDGPAELDLDKEQAAILGEAEVRLPR